jgi:beta-lactamase regulating signal transducer with metallopeptidase domain
MPLLLAWLIHGVALAATIYGLLRLTRGPSAAMRYAIYWSALIVVLALPLASFARVPSWLSPLSSSPLSPLSLLSQLSPSLRSLPAAPQATTQARHEDADHVAARGASSSDAPTGAPSAASSAASAGNSSGASASTSAAATAVGAGAGAGAPTSTAKAATSATAAPSRQSWSWPTVELPRLPDWLVAIAIGLWLGTVLLALLRVALGIDAIQRLKASCRPFPAARARRLTGWHDARRRGRLVELCLCDDVASASFLGLTRPVIAISPALAATLSDEELDLTVLHEFAHVQRRDDWTKLAQLTVVAICGWHPAVRLLDRAIDLERESACDDWVVRATGAPRSYARCLVKIAETMPRATEALVPGAHGAEAPMETRIKRLLDKGRARGAWAPLPAAATAVAMAMLALMITHASPLPRIVRTAAPAQQMNAAARGNAMRAPDAATSLALRRGTTPRRGDVVDASADIPPQPASSLATSDITERATSTSPASLAAASLTELPQNVAAESDGSFALAPPAARGDRAVRPVRTTSAQTPSILAASMSPFASRPRSRQQLTPRDAQPRDVADGVRNDSMIAGALSQELPASATSSLRPAPTSTSTPRPTPAQPATQTPAQTIAQHAPAGSASASAPASAPGSGSASGSRLTTFPIERAPVSPIGLSAANSAAANDGDDDDDPAPGAGGSSAAEGRADSHAPWGAGAVGGGLKAASLATGDGLKDASTATGSGVRTAGAVTGRATGAAATKTAGGLKKAGAETGHAFGRVKRAFGSIF